MTTSYTWASYPTPETSGFEVTARAGLEQNKENSQDMEVRLNAIEQGAAASIVMHTTDATLTNADFGKRHVINSASPVVVTLPEATESDIGKTLFFRKKGAGSVTLTPQGADTINGWADLVAGMSETHAVSLYIEAEGEYVIDYQLGEWMPS